MPYWLTIKQGGAEVDSVGPYSYRKAAAVEAKKLAKEAAGGFYEIVEHTTQGDRGPFGRDLEAKNPWRRRNARAESHGDGVFGVFADDAVGRWTRWTTHAEARRAAAQQQAQHDPRGVWVRFGVRRMVRGLWQTVDPLGSFASHGVAMAANPAKAVLTAKAKAAEARKKAKAAEKAAKKAEHAAAKAQAQVAKYKVKVSKAKTGKSGKLISPFCGSMTPYPVVTGYTGGDMTFEIVEAKANRRRNAASPQGAAQKIVYDYAKSLGSYMIGDLTWSRTHMHFGRIVNAAEALAKKGLIHFDGARVSIARRNAKANGGREWGYGVASSGSLDGIPRVSASRGPGWPTVTVYKPTSASQRNRLKKAGYGYNTFLRGWIRATSKARN